MPRTTAWTESDMPDLHGLVTVVTGANSGLGFQTARAFAAAGAHVVLACRSEQRGKAAIRALSEIVPASSLELQPLDLGDLVSVREAASDLRTRHPTIDVLVNNAGVAWPKGADASSGVERQLAVNHLGHYVLTADLLPALLQAASARVVSLTSIAHRAGRITSRSLAAPPTHPFLRYARSKLANLVFTYELQRRLSAAGLRCSAFAAHPGGAQTDLIRDGMLVPAAVIRRLVEFQDAASGALPTLRAATDPTLLGGLVIGPRGPLQLRGAPIPVRTTRHARSAAAGRLLWQYSEQTTGARFSL